MIDGIGYGVAIRKLKYCQVFALVFLLFSVCGFLFYNKVVVLVWKLGDCNSVVGHPDLQCFDYAGNQLKKDFSWAISAYSLDYFEQLYVILGDISSFSNVNNVVILTGDCEGNGTMSNYETLFPDLSITCYEVISRCNNDRTSRVYGADTKMYYFDLWKYGFKKVVAIDSDVKFLANADELFCYEGKSSSEIFAMHRGGDQLINSGVMIFQPTKKLSNLVSELMDEQKEGAEWTKDWKECEHQKLIQILLDRRHIFANCIPKTYNLRMGSSNNRLLDDPRIKIVHFNIPKCKPWLNFSECPRQDIAGVTKIAYEMWKERDKTIRNRLKMH